MNLDALTNGHNAEEAASNNSLELYNMDQDNTGNNSTEQNNMDQDNTGNNNPEQNNMDQDNTSNNNAEQSNMDQDNTGYNNTEQGMMVQDNTGTNNAEQNNMKQQNTSNNNHLLYNANFDINNAVQRSKRTSTTMKKKEEVIKRIFTVTCQKMLYQLHLEKFTKKERNLSKAMQLRHIHINLGNKYDILQKQMNKCSKKSGGGKITPRLIKRGTVQKGRSEMMMRAKAARVARLHSRSSTSTGSTRVFVTLARPLEGVEVETTPILDSPALYLKDLAEMHPVTSASTGVDTAQCGDGRQLFEEDSLKATIDSNLVKLSPVAPPTQPNGPLQSLDVHITETLVSQAIDINKSGDMFMMKYQYYLKKYRNAERANHESYQLVTSRKDVCEDNTAIVSKIMSCVNDTSMPSSDVTPLSSLKDKSMPFSEAVPMSSLEDTPMSSLEDAPMSSSKNRRMFISSMEDIPVSSLGDMPMLSLGDMPMPHLEDMPMLSFGDMLMPTLENIPTLSFEDLPVLSPEDMPVSFLEDSSCFDDMSASSLEDLLASYLKDMPMTSLEV